jgi:hypothetical protein
MTTPINIRNIHSKLGSTIFPFCLCFLVISSVGFLFWPGYMSPDSIAQLNQGLTGNYSDHHPPMMSFFWKMFSFIHEGPQLYLLFHLCLLFFSVCILQTIVKQRWLKFAIALIPLVPAIAAYSGALWKDVGFAYSFLLAAMMLTKSTITGHPLTYPKIILIFLLLIYGVSVKYQAQFVLPIMSFWFGLTLAHSKSNFKKVLIGIFITLCVLFSVFLFNTALVPSQKEEHSWQMVKLYDLAGISVRTQKNLFPKFVIAHDYFSMENVKKIYSPERVDELIHNWHASAPLSLASNTEERNSLWHTWANAVIHYPIAYLSHRFSVWYNMISKSPIKPLFQLASLEKVPSNVKFILKQGGDIVFSLGRELSRFSLTLPFLFIYIFWGAHLCKRNNRYGLALLMMNLTALSLLLCLFVFSMAADLRYIYLSTCFLFFSHPIALAALLERQTPEKCHLTKI